VKKKRGGAVRVPALLDIDGVSITNRQQLMAVGLNGRVQVAGELGRAVGFLAGLVGRGNSDIGTISSKTLRRELALGHTYRALHICNKYSTDTMVRFGTRVNKVEHKQWCNGVGGVACVRLCV